MFNALPLWIDIIWIPILFFGVHKKHRWWALAFVIFSIAIIHLLAETMDHIGYPKGIMSVMSSNVHTRGLAVSSFYYILFLLMAHFSPKTEGIVFMAASLTFFFMIFATMAIVMLL